MKDKSRLDALMDLYDNDAAVIDARRGGLIVGRSHDDGGITVVRANYKDGFPLWAELEMEGMEFLMNPAATEKHRCRLMEINSLNQPTDASDDGCNIACDVYNVEGGNAILITNYEQAIINKYATRRYIRELCELNDNPSYEPPQELPAALSYRAYLEIFGARE